MTVRKWRAFFKTRLKRQVSARCQLGILHSPGAAKLEAEMRNTLLKNLVLAHYPQIEASEVSDFDRVSLLRQWAATATNWSNKEGLLDRPGTTNPYAEGFNFYSQDAPTIYAAFMGDRGGVWCSGTAYALARLYELFGYRAFRVGIGAPNSDAQHIITLVEIEYGGGGKKILSVQDAYFDITYVHTHGRPMDYFELLELLRARRDSDVAMVGSSIPMTRDMLYFENGYVKKVQGLYSLEDFKEQFCTELNSFYEEWGFPQSVLYIHLSVLHVYDLDRTEREQFISKLLARHVWKA